MGVGQSRVRALGLGLCVLDEGSVESFAPSHIPPLCKALWPRLFLKAALKVTPWPRLSQEKQMPQVVLFSRELLGAGQSPDHAATSTAHV